MIDDPTRPASLPRLLQSILNRLDILERTRPIEAAEAVTITGGNWANRASYQPLTVTRVGNLVNLCGVLASSGTPTAYETIATLDAQFRPPARVSSAGIGVAGVAYRVDVSSGGVLMCNVTTAITHVAVNLTWAV